MDQVSDNQDDFSSSRSPEGAAEDEDSKEQTDENPEGENEGVSALEQHKEEEEVPPPPDAVEADDVSENLKTKNDSSEVPHM